MELIKLTESQKREAGVNYRPSKLTKLIEEFSNSEEEIMELRFEEGEYSSPTTCITSIKTHLRKTNKHWLGAKTVRGRIYLFKITPRPEEDEEKVCTDCGGTFTITAENKKWLKERGLRPFIRCEKCREQRKSQQS